MMLYPGRVQKPSMVKIGRLIALDSPWPGLLRLPARPWPGMLVGLWLDYKPAGIGQPAFDCELCPRRAPSAPCCEYGTHRTDRLTVL